MQNEAPKPITLWFLIKNFAFYALSICIAFFLIALFRAPAEFQLANSILVTPVFLAIAAMGSVLGMLVHLEERIRHKKLWKRIFGAELPTKLLPLGFHLEDGRFVGTYRGYDASVMLVYIGGRSVTRHIHITFRRPVDIEKENEYLRRSWNMIRKRRMKQGLITFGENEILVLPEDEVWLPAIERLFDKLAKRLDNRTIVEGGINQKAR